MNIRRIMNVVLLVLMGLVVLPEEVSAQVRKRTNIVRRTTATTKTTNQQSSTLAKQMPQLNMVGNRSAYELLACPLGSLSCNFATLTEQTVVEQVSKNTQWKVSTDKAGTEHAWHTQKLAYQDCDISIGTVYFENNKITRWKYFMIFDDDVNGDGVQPTLKIANMMVSELNRSGLNVELSPAYQNNAKMKMWFISYGETRVGQIIYNRNEYIGNYLNFEFFGKTPLPQPTATHIAMRAGVQQQQNHSVSDGLNQQQGAQSGYYIPEGGTAPVPNGFKPDIIGVSKNGIVTVNGVERPDRTYTGTNSSNSGNTSSGGHKGHVTNAQIQQQINIVNQAEARWKADPSNHNARANYEAAKRALDAMQRK